MSLLSGTPRAPSGLLELLGLKSNGEQPRAVGAEISPSIDMLPFYGMERLFTANTPVAAAAFPLNGTVSVGFARMYAAFSVQVTLGAAAGTRLSIRFGVRSPSGANPLVILAQEFVAAPFLVAGGQYEAIWLAPYPLVYPPGAQFNAVATSDAAGADHVMTLKALSLDLSSTG